MSIGSLALLSVVCGLSLRIGSLGPFAWRAAALGLFVAAAVVAVAAGACLPDEFWGVGSVI